MPAKAFLSIVLIRLFSINNRLIFTEPKALEDDIEEKTEEQKEEMIMVFLQSLED